MRTAIFVGLYTIACAISDRPVFNSSAYDSDTVILSIILGCLMVGDTIAFFKNVKEVGKED